MKVVIFGATGMVGKGVLLECLDDARVEHVLLVSRHATDVSHPKIREIVHGDFMEFGDIQTTFADLDACFAEADRDKVFGVPTFIVDGEPFWGEDRINWVIRKLDAMSLRRA